MPSKDKVSMYDVFGVARDVPLNYVERPSVDGKLVDALSQQKHIVVHGSSKQGKTCLRKYVLAEYDYFVITCNNRWTLKDLHGAILKAAGFQIEASTSKTIGGDFKVRAEIKGGIAIPLVGELGGGGGGETSHSEQDTTVLHSLDLDLNDVNDVIAALNVANCRPYVVLEDFHYLPDETQRDFAVALKTFHEESQYCFIVIGVWLDENRLVQHNGDLSGRVMSVNADIWKRDELIAVMRDGGNLLKVQFEPQFVEDLLDGAFESVWIVQEVCKLACEAAGVFQAQDTFVQVGGNIAELISQVVDQHSPRFHGFLANFAEGFQATELEMYKWLLYCVVSAPIADVEHGLSYAGVTAAINGAHPDTPINAGNITQALRSTASLQITRLGVKPIILDYDQTRRSLNVVDRSFLIWLQHQIPTDLMTTIGVDLDDS